MKSIVYTYDEQGVPLKMFISQKCLKSKLEKLGRNSAKFTVPANTKQEKMKIARKAEAPFMWRTPASGKRVPPSQPIQRRSSKGFWVTDHLPLP